MHRCGDPAPITDRTTTRNGAVPVMGDCRQYLKKSGTAIGRHRGPASGRRPVVDEHFADALPFVSRTARAKAVGDRLNLCEGFRLAMLLEQVEKNRLEHDYKSDAIAERNRCLKCNCTAHGMTDKSYRSIDN